MLLCMSGLQVQPVCSSKWHNWLLCTVKLQLHTWMAAPDLAFMLLSTSACSSKGLAATKLAFMLLCTTIEVLDPATVPQVHAGLAAHSIERGRTSLTTTSSFISQSHHLKLHGKQRQSVSGPCCGNSNPCSKRRISSSVAQRTATLRH